MSTNLTSMDYPKALLVLQVNQNTVIKMKSDLMPMITKIHPCHTHKNDRHKKISTFSP